ncbi:MAG: VOC family protein [Verrucomicrobiota bacterium]
MNLPKIEPYIMFNGRTEEALEFYKTALGANVACIMKFSDCPEGAPPGQEDKVMHAAFTVGDCTIMASDGCGEEEPISGISLSISVATNEEVDKFFDALAKNGEVTMPAGETFWSPRFAMVKDKFGVHWMIGVLSKECA